MKPGDLVALAHLYEDSGLFLTDRPGVSEVTHQVPARVVGVVIATWDPCARGRSRLAVGVAADEEEVFVLVGGVIGWHWARSFRPA